MRTGRAKDCHKIPGFLRLMSKEGGNYWVSFSGQKILRGLAFNVSTQMQDGFANAMARAGEKAHRSA